MSESHLAHLSLGSNIHPDQNLVRAIQLLQEYGEIVKVSNAWESESVGAEGPNYLNACLCMRTGLRQEDFKAQIILPIEIKLGRIRTENRFAPRTMDIDIILFDDRSMNDRYWDQAFVVIPLAEIHPTFINPLTFEQMVETAARLHRQIWMEARPQVLKQFSGNPSAA